MESECPEAGIAPAAGRRVPVAAGRRPSAVAVQPQNTTATTRTSFGEGPPG